MSGFTFARVDASCSRMQFGKAPSAPSMPTSPDASPPSRNITSLSCARADRSHSTSTMSSYRPQYSTSRGNDDGSERSYLARSPHHSRHHGEEGWVTFQQDHDGSSRRARSPIRQHPVSRGYRRQDRSRSRTRKHSPIRAHYRSRSGSLERYYGNYTTDRRTGYDSWRPARDTYRPRPRESAPVSSTPVDRAFEVKKMPQWRKVLLRDEGAEPENDNERGYVAWLKDKTNRQTGHDSWRPARDTYRPQLHETGPMGSNSADRSFDVKKIPRWRNVQLRDEGAEPEHHSEREYVAWRNTKTLGSRIAERPPAVPHVDDAHASLAEEVLLREPKSHRHLSSTTREVLLTVRVLI